MPHYLKGVKKYDRSDSFPFVYEPCMQNSVWFIIKRKIVVIRSYFDKFKKNYKSISFSVYLLEKLFSMHRSHGSLNFQKFSIASQN